MSLLAQLALGMPISLSRPLESEAIAVIHRALDTYYGGVCYAPLYLFCGKHLAAKLLASIDPAGRLGGTATGDPTYPLPVASQTRILVRGIVPKAERT